MVRFSKFKSLQKGDKNLFINVVGTHLRTVHLRCHCTALEELFRFHQHFVYLINKSNIYQKAALAKGARCDAFIKCIISLVYYFYIISASQALETRGGVFSSKVTSIHEIKKPFKCEICDVQFGLEHEKNRVKSQKLLSTF